MFSIISSPYMVLEVLMCQKFIFGVRDKIYILGPALNRHCRMYKLSIRTNCKMATLTCNMV